MATTLLIRHAQASFGAAVYDQLSGLGIRQARLAGEYLATTIGPVARITCGRLTRQRATATELAAKVRTAQGVAPDIEIDPRLDELDIDGHMQRFVAELNDPRGSLAGHFAAAKTSSRSYLKVIHRVFTHWQAVAEEPGLESWRAFAARTRAVVQDIACTSVSGETTIAVSSGAVIATIVQGILGLPAAGVYPLFEAMMNCSITRLLHTRERISLATFNETGYLAAMGARAGETNLLTYL